MSLYPWLEAAAKRLEAARAAGRLPSALLIHAAPGIGAQALLYHFAKLRLCQDVARPCGRCSQCRRVEAGEHPDFQLVGPDPDLKLEQISIGQIRELAERLALSSYEGHGTVVALDPADVLNRNAANALLKTLEEPRSDAHLVLLASSPSRLPATIRSRCQKLAVAAPDRAAALDWLVRQKPAHAAEWPQVLELLGVAPLEALQADVRQMLGIRQEVRQVLAEAMQGRIDIVRTAEAWAKDELPLRLRGLENLLTADLLANGSGGGQPGGTRSLDIAAALRLLEELRGLQLGLSGAALNRSLAVERQLWSLNSAAGGQSR